MNSYPPKNVNYVYYVSYVNVKGITFFWQCKICKYTCVEDKDDDDDDDNNNNSWVNKT